jgi:putative spermidine/putrescine transport system substrate-binding protein
MTAGRLARRSVVLGAAATAAAASVGPFVHTPAKGAATKMVYSGWGGAYQDAVREAILQPFTKATGIEVVEIKIGPTIAHVKAQVQSKNVEWDVAELEAPDMLRGKEEGLLEKIDRSRIDTKDLVKEAIDDVGIGCIVFSTVLAYSTLTYPAGKPHPKSWTDFWDVKKWPGRRFLQDQVKLNLEFALMADGVPKDKLYPIDVDRAFKSLDRIKPHIAVWWKKGAQPPQLLTDKEADLGSSWNGRSPARSGRAHDGRRVEPGIAQYQYYNIPKGAPNRENALKFIDFAIKPERQARSAELIPYGPTNRKAIAMIDKKKAPDLPTYPENLKRQAPFNEEWGLKNADALIKRWEAWKLA